jgi:hypothetical protein
VQLGQEREPVQLGQEREAEQLSEKTEMVLMRREALAWTVERFAGGARALQGGSSARKTNWD